MYQNPCILFGLRPKPQEAKELILKATYRESARATVVEHTGRGTAEEEAA